MIDFLRVMSTSAHRGRLAAAMILAVATALALTGCALLLPKASPQPAFYSLQALLDHTAGQRDSAIGLVPHATALTGPVLVVHVPVAAPGFDTARIVYTQEPHRLQIYARHEWVDTPARMLAPLIVAALERSSTFHAVVLAPSAASGSVQLDTQLLRLQHEFGPLPSQVRLVLRAQLIDIKTRQVLATREFENVSHSLTEDAQGGVAAAQQATHMLLGELALWCRRVAHSAP
jgi:cholesterol transport system auxiliary component